MLDSKHTLPCQCLIKLGTIKYAEIIFKSIPENNSKPKNTWFEGFVTGLHEASVIDDKTYDELIDEISRIVYPIE